MDHVKEMKCSEQILIISCWIMARTSCSSLLTGEYLGWWSSDCTECEGWISDCGVKQQTELTPLCLCGATKTLTGKHETNYRSLLNGLQTISLATLPHFRQDTCSGVPVVKVGELLTQGIILTYTSSSSPESLQKFVQIGL